MKKWKIVLPTLLATSGLPLVSMVGCNKDQSILILLDKPVYFEGICHSIYTSGPMSFKVGEKYQFRFDMYKFDEELWEEGPLDDLYWLFSFQDEINSEVKVDVDINLVKFNGKQLKETDDDEIQPGYYQILEDENTWELDLKGNFTKPSDSLIIWLTPNQPIENLYVEFECD